MADIKMDIHLKLNKNNPSHVRLAEMLATIPIKSKTAFMVLAFEAYMEANPLGVNMGELKEFQKRSYHSYMPNSPVKENNKNASSAPAVIPAGEVQEVPENGTVTNAIDKALSVFGVEI